MKNLVAAVILGRLATEYPVEYQRLVDLQAGLVRANNLIATVEGLDEDFLEEAARLARIFRLSLTGDRSLGYVRLPSRVGSDGYISRRRRVGTRRYWFTW